MSFFGMTWMVLRQLVRGPATLRYPFEPARPSPGTRGVLVIDVNACSFCGACVKRCPTDALAVDRAARTWTIDRLRCIMCGACVEVCPKKCLTLTTTHTPPTLTRDREVFTGPAPAAPAAAKPPAA